MHHLRSVLFVALSAAAVACGSSTPPGKTPPGNTPTAKVDVAIASVTLADDCGTGPTASPPEPEDQEHASADEPPPSAGASMKISAGDRACEQSSIQLRVGNTTTAAAKLAIQKVELLDDSGSKVADLTPRAPSKWTDDSYQAWDEQVAPSQVVQVSYALSAPSVSRGETYTVRITIATADGERTLEQKTTLQAEASLPPGVVT